MLAVVRTTFPYYVDFDAFGPIEAPGQATADQCFASDATGSSIDIAGDIS